MAQSYCSINHLIIIILMGCRQSYPERQLDTGVPFITSNVVLPFKQLPVAYVFMCLLCAFVFELNMDFSLVGCLYFSWLFMRLFMVTKHTPPNQIGDSSNAFALQTFFPEKAQSTVDWLCRVTYKFANLCKLVDGIQACLKSRNIALAKAKAENRKKALKMLQNEIDKKEEDKDDEEADLEQSKSGNLDNTNDEDKVVSKKKLVSGRQKSSQKSTIEN